jgi:type III restriction enzyme
MPRACYLLQIRSTQSETLNEQVIGRIRRNPCLVDFDDFSKEQQQKIMKAYIDGVVQQDTKEIEFVKRNHSLEIETTKLKNKVPMKIKNISKIVLKDVGIENIFELKQK